MTNPTSLRGACRRCGASPGATDFVIYGVCLPCVNWIVMNTMERADPIIEMNRQALLERSRVGLKKYGTTLYENPLSLREWLRHALEECLDQANYLRAAIVTLECQELRAKIADCDAQIARLLALPEDTNPGALMGIGDYACEKDILTQKLKEITP